MLQKLGPHTILDTPAGRKWLAVAPIARVLDRSYLLDLAPPGAFTIFRRYFASQPVDTSGGEIAAAILQALGGRRPSCVSLYCMPEQFGNAALRSFRQAAEAVKVLHEAGLHVAGPGWSVGQPQK